MIVTAGASVFDDVSVARPPVGASAEPIVTVTAPPTPPPICAVTLVASPVVSSYSCPVVENDDSVRGCVSR